MNIKGSICICMRCGGARGPMKDYSRVGTNVMQLPTCHDEVLPVCGYLRVIMRPLYHLWRYMAVVQQDPRRVVNRRLPSRPVCTCMHRRVPYTPHKTLQYARAIFGGKPIGC